jgi:sortase B
MKPKMRKLLTILLALVFLFGITMYFGQQKDKAAGMQSYEAALEVATAPRNTIDTVPAEPTLPEETEAVREPQWVPESVDEDDPNLEFLEKINLEVLRAVNPDVVGWLLIPDSQISYPLMQGQDNDYYLNHTWEGEENVVGSIFLEHRNHSDLTDFNTIVYGHNMKDGAMFAGIHQYRDKEFWQEHPFVYILSDMGVYRYEIFSTYQAATDSNTYGMSFLSQNTREKFLEMALENSVIQTGIEPSTTDRVLTLSTCSGGSYANRWVVHARLKMILQ